LTIAAPETVTEADHTFSAAGGLCLKRGRAAGSKSGLTGLTEKFTRDVTNI
jgi:hypothetical protein